MTTRIHPKVPFYGQVSPLYVGCRFSIEQARHATTNVAGQPAVYSWAQEIPANAFVLNAAVHNVALWNYGTAADIIVGDATDPDGFFVSSSLKGTDVLAGESIDLGSGTAMAGGRIGAYIANSQWAAGRFSTSSRVLTATLTCTGTVATTGECYVLFSYVIFNEGRLPLWVPDVTLT